MQHRFKLKLTFLGLVRVLHHCLSRECPPLDKVIINLATFLCANPEETPQVDMFRFEDKVDARHGIMSLYLSEREAEKAQRLVFLIFLSLSRIKNAANKVVIETCKSLNLASLTSYLYMTYLYNLLFYMKIFFIL